MSWRERIVAHPLPDVIAAVFLAAAFAVSGALFVRAQDAFTFPLPCQEAGITDPEKCKAYMEQFLIQGPVATEPEPLPSLEVPEECRLRGIFNPEQCKRYLESLSAPPPEPTSQLSEACIAAGITDPEPCKLYMEKLSSSGTISEPAPTLPPPEPTFQLPDACVKAGITGPEECKAYMEKLLSSGTATLPPPPTTSEPTDCASKCAAAKEACYAAAGGVASEMDQCSVAAGACYQACSSAGSAADVCLRERCWPVVKSCLAGTGDSPEALAACEKVIGQCASQCVKGTVTSLTASECVTYTCSLVEGRCMAGDAGSFSQESIAAAGGRIPRCQQAGNDCRVRCGGGQVGEVSFQTMMPEPCRRKGLTSPDACRKFMESLFAGGESPEAVFSPQDFEKTFDPASFFPPACLEAGVTEPEACAELMKSSFTLQLPKECQEAKMTEPEDCQALFVQRGLLPECREAGARTQEECKAIIVARNLPADCVEAKAFDEESCRKLVQDAYLPKACREAGAKDERACEKVIFDKYGRPDECAGLDDLGCRRLIEAGKVESDILEKIEANELPDRCVAAGAGTFEECDGLTRERTMPAECREAGVFSPEGCEKHLFEKYKKQGEEQFRAAMPAECREAGVEEPEDCRKLMEAKFFPKECVEAGVTDSEGCKTYLQAKYLPPECKAQGLSTREECEAYLRKKHLEPICEAQGLDDRAACEEFAYARLGEAVRCRGLDEAECALAVKGRHLGGILDAKDRLERIDERIKEARGEGRTIDLGAPGEGPEGLRDILPFEARGRRRLAVIDSQAQVAVTEGDEIESASPVVLAYDADGDGITDDIEERHGLDPEAPNAVEDLPEDLTPVEEAIIGGKTLGQPVLEGEEDPALAVAGAETVEEALVLEGEAPAGEIVTLYLYSPLPVVVTVTTGTDGRWTYDFSDALKDGEHRAYVAVNDSTGKVLRKSGPLSFFIREARAVTAEEFLAEATAAPAPYVDVEASAPVTRSIRRFLLAGAGILIVASLLAWYLMRGRKDSTMNP